MERCLLDLDGVLCRFHEGALAFHGLPDPYLQPENLGKYEVHELLGMDREAYYGLLGEEFWASLEPTAEFEAILRYAERSFGRENVCLATSPVRTRGCFEGKLRWIQRHLPEYHQSRRFLVGPPKWFAAGPQVTLVDDSDNNVEKFRAWGGQAILVPRPWNKNHSVPGCPALYVGVALGEVW